MIIRLTGAHNAESAKTRLAGIVIDGRVALDAGSLTRSLTLEELQDLRHVFLTHRHYDHIRDLPALAYATPLAGTLHVYGLQDTLDTLSAHLMNNVIYSAYQERTGEDGNPRARFHLLEPDRSVTLGDLVVTPYTANHTAPAVGFHVSGGERSLYYTGDTAPGFSAHLATSPPDILISEVTYSNAGAGDASRNGHMTPALLQREIGSTVAESGWTPRVIVVHLNPAHEQKIAHEVEALRAETGWDITLGAADMALTV
ncbi:MAG: MBL fold metallo-hydrolase [Dehalococcoidia bacterium]|nr:MBL fold metallo-hydrolase [Dehalococcoidia bacterium]